MQNYPDEPDIAHVADEDEKNAGNVKKAEDVEDSLECRDEPELQKSKDGLVDGPVEPDTGEKVEELEELKELKELKELLPPTPPTCLPYPETHLY